MRCNEALHNRKRGAKYTATLLQHSRKHFCCSDDPHSYSQSTAETVQPLLDGTLEYAADKAELESAVKQSRKEAQQPSQSLLSVEGTTS